MKKRQRTLLRIETSERILIRAKMRVKQRVDDSGVKAGTEAPDKECRREIPGSGTGETFQAKGE